MSVFDDIFQTSGDLPANSLFGSGNKFKAAKAAAGLEVVEAADITTNAVDSAVDAATLPVKSKNASRKRKAHEAAEAAPISKSENKVSTKAAGAGTVQKRHPHTAAPTQEALAVKPKKQKINSSAAPGSSLADAATPRPINNVPNVTSAAKHETSQRLTSEEEAAKLRRTVFVGNLPSDAKKKMLQKEFGQYGSIESIRKRSVPVKLDARMSRKAAIITGNISESRGTIHAYVVFHDEPAALAALASNMHMVGGLHIRVDRAGQSAHGSAGGSVMYERNRTVFVGNLPFDVEDEELIVFFNENCTKLGIPDPVDAVRVVRDSASQLGKGFGFVQFSDQAAARAALGCDGQLLRKRPIRITKAVKVPAHLKDVTNGKLAKKSPARDASERKTAAGAKHSRPGNKAVVALQRKAEPAENWQGFKTKGSKKTVAAAVTKSTGSGQRPVEGKRKTSEKRPSVVMRKQRILAK